MTSPIRNTPPQPQLLQAQTLGLRPEAESLIEGETSATQNGQVQARVFASQDEALRYAAADGGDELVVELEDGTWAVAELKSTSQQLRGVAPEQVEQDQYNHTKVKAEAVFDPQQSLNFGERLISRDRQYHNGEQYVSTRMDRIESLQPAALPADASPDQVARQEQRQIDRTEQLARIAVAGEVGAYRQGLTTDSVRGETYKNNLASVVSRLDESIATLEARATRQAEDPAQAEALQQTRSQLESLTTQRGILRGRLLVASQGGGNVPGLQREGQPVPMGASRNNFGEVRESLMQRRGALQDQLAQTQDPQQQASLQEQLDLVEAEYAQNTRQEREVQGAALAMRMRVGSLATMNQSLQRASSSLQTKTERFVALHNQLLEQQAGPSGPRQNVAATRRTMEGLQREIEQERNALVRSLRAEARVFRDNSGSQAAQARTFIDAQIAEIESLNFTDPTQSRAAVARLNAIQAELLPVITAQSEIWRGISPQEGRLLRDLDQNVNTYVADYARAREASARLEARVELAENLPDFAYNPLNLRDVSAARESWTPGSTGLSGVDANRMINETYNALDQQFSRFLGDPPTANWMSFGKYASREAGTQIQNLEAALEALETLKQVDGSMGNDERAVGALIEVMTSDRMLEQAVRMAFEVGEDVDMRTFLTSALLGPPGTAVVPGVVAGADFANRMIGALGGLREAMVTGNTRIYENIARPYDVFMQAESRGEDGLAALRAAGYDGPHAGQTFTSDRVRDPQGFVISAFEKYKEASIRADQASILEQEDPVGNRARIDALRAERQTLIHEANLLIGMQEQLTILQAPDIFGDPMVSRLLGAMSGTMSLTDANGRHELLPGSSPSTANWADFETRMGLREVPAGTAGAIGARMPDGSTRHFQPTYPAGTISEYFQSNYTGAAAQNLISSPPRPIETLYEHSTDGQVTPTDVAKDVLIPLPLRPVSWLF